MHVFTHAHKIKGVINLTAEQKTAGARLPRHRGRDEDALDRCCWMEGDRRTHATRAQETPLLFKLYFLETTLELKT